LLTAVLLALFPAYRFFNTSLPAKQAEPSVPPPGSTDTPVTEIAKRGSNQWSLEHPQNKAGALFHLHCGQFGRQFLISSM
jgi:hypothetical protein